MVWQMFTDFKGTFKNAFGHVSPSSTYKATNFFKMYLTNNFQNEFKYFQSEEIYGNYGVDFIYEKLTTLVITVNNRI